MRIVKKLWYNIKKSYSLIVPMWLNLMVSEGFQGGGFVKSPLGVFFFEIENRFFFSQKKK